MSVSESELIFDWNRDGGEDLRPGRGTVELDDETLRDGLQSPSVISPPIEDKVRILHLMAELGIESANLGLPGAGPHVVADVEHLARVFPTAHDCVNLLLCPLERSSLNVQRRQLLDCCVNRGLPGYRGALYLLSVVDPLELQFASRHRS